MQAVILAGGFGTRLSEETQSRPKPMVEIGGKPLLWHLMKNLGNQGVNRFIICCGYKGYMIKEYFANYHLHISDITVKTLINEIVVHQTKAEPWEITLVDTGEAAMTGGRLRAVKDYIDGSRFLFTYGDGLADVEVEKIISSHEKSRKIATVTAVQPPGRFGNLAIDEDGAVNYFEEKPTGENGTWINGGFFILEKEVIGIIDGEHTIWEGAPLKKLTDDRQLNAYKHGGFWQPMDTLRDKRYLEELWSSGNAPWCNWEAS